MSWANEWQIELLRMEALEIHGNLYIDTRTGTTIYPAPLVDGFAVARANAIQTIRRAYRLPRRLLCSFDEAFLPPDPKVRARLRRMHSEYSRRTRRRNRRDR